MEWNAIVAGIKRSYMRRFETLAEAEEFAAWLQEEEEEEEEIRA